MTDLAQKIADAAEVAVLGGPRLLPDAKQRLTDTIRAALADAGGAVAVHGITLEQIARARDVALTARQPQERGEAVAQECGSCGCEYGEHTPNCPHGGKKAVAQGGGVDVDEVAALTCPNAAGFEGPETFPDCGRCVVCRARALLASPAGAVGDGWIAVGDRLPDINSRVLGLWWDGCDEGHPEVLYYEGIHAWFDISGRVGAPDYWAPIQPLPPAPAATKEGGRP